jgi:nicotinamide mononucleotide transporter
MFEILGVIVGLVYLWLEYKANIWLWVAGIIMPVCYIYVFYQSKFYAGMTINIYYLFASIYGLNKWHKEANPEDKMPAVKRFPLRFVPVVLAVVGALFLIINYLLVHFTDSNVAVGDSLITALSIAGMWMLAHKYLEQWLVWIIANLISVFVYMNNGLVFTGILYLVYTIVSIFGYFNWKKNVQQI